MVIALLTWCENWVFLSFKFQGQRATHKEMNPGVVFLNQVIRKNGDYCLPYTRNLWKLSSSGGKYSYEKINRAYNTDQELFSPNYQHYSSIYCTRAGWETQRSVDVREWLINLRNMYPKGKGCMTFRLFVFEKLQLYHFHFVTHLCLYYCV